LIDEQIGFSDRRAAGFVVDIGVRALAMAEVVQRNLARLPGGLAQRLDERLGVDFNLQDRCAPVSRRDLEKPLAPCKRLA
jgi:hypothetical protein